MTSPSEGLRDILDANGTVFVDSWYSNIGGLRDDPFCVGFIDGSDRPPEVSAGIDYPSVQILVMAPRYVDAYNKSRDIYNILHALPTPNATYSDVDSCLAVNQPTWLGRDDRDRARFTMDFRMIISPSNPGHRL